MHHIATGLICCTWNNFPVLTQVAACGLKAGSSLSRKLHFFQVLETSGYRTGEKTHIWGFKNSFCAYADIVLSPSPCLKLGYNVPRTPTQDVIYQENIIL